MNKILMDDLGWEVGTHGQAEPGRKNKNEGGPNVVEEVYKGGPYDAKIVGVYVTDADGKPVRIGDSMLESDLGLPKAEFESTDEKGIPDGKIKIELDPINPGKIIITPEINEDGELVFVPKYEPPPPPSTERPGGGQPSPSERIAGAIAPLLNSMMPLLRQMMGLPPYPQPYPTACPPGYTAPQPTGFGSIFGSGTSQQQCVPSPYTCESGTSQTRDAYGYVACTPNPKPVPSEFSMQFTCDSASVTNGQRTPNKVTWSCSDGTASSTAFATGGAVSGEARIRIGSSTQRETKLELSCVKDGKELGKKSCNITILRPTIALAASRSEIDPKEASNIAWVTSRMNRCTLFGPQGSMLSGASAIAYTGSLTRSGIYTLICESNTAIFRTPVTIRVRGDSQAPLPSNIPSDVFGSNIPDEPGTKVCKPNSSQCVSMQ